MVHFLWIEQQRKFILRQIFGKMPRQHTVQQPSSTASLVYLLATRKIHATPSSLCQKIVTATHRFEELIAGRAYIIEVAAVATDRWRAYIVRVPGVPTALMPFYGRTPDEAAHQLSAWLTRAYDRTSPPGGTV